MWGFISGIVGAVVGGVVAAVTAIAAAPAIIGGAIIGVALCVTGVLGVCQNGSSGGSGSTSPTSPVLTLQAITRSGTLATGQKQTFSSGVQNTGTAATPAGNKSRLCIDNSNCASSGTGSLGTFSIPALPAGALSAIFSATWTATVGNHTAYFCVVGGNACSTLAFTVVTANKRDCILDGQVIKNGTTHLSYNTATVPAGKSCSDTDANGNSLYSQNRTCTNGVLSGSNAYSNYSCVAGTFPPQTAATLSSDSSLVRSGDAVLLSWSGGNATSCSIAGTNGFSSTALAGTNVSSGPITQKTTFNLVCTLGSSSKTASITVNLIPTVKEI